MVTLRPTQKLRSLLPLSAGPSVPSDTALGDWYVNRLLVDRRPLLLLVSASSLLPIVIPARDVRSLPSRLGDLVAARLRRLGVSESVLGAERDAMGTVSVGPTLDRSVVGILVDFANGVPHYLDQGRWDETSLTDVEARLENTPCFASKRASQCVFPAAKAVELLNAKWLGATA